MTQIDAPRQVRLAAALTWAMAAAGLLLIVVGLVELHWWGTSAAAKLASLFADIVRQDGPTPPTLLRGRGGAVELIIIGAACLAYAGLAPLLARGRSWARTAALAASGALAFLGLLGIGADGATSSDFPRYFRELSLAGLEALVPEVKSLLYPAWYSWVEDIAQGLQVALSLACFVAIGWAVIRHADYFTTKKADQAGPDEWAAAFSRLHKKTVSTPESD